jgi:gamma-glutamyltranspeptidase / glutathione hydrolase
MARSRFAMCRLVLTIAVCAGLLDGLGFQSSVPLSGTVMAVNGMVATVAPMAAQAGLRILQQGGNAFDAAVAVSAVTAITDTPSHAGLGGTGYGMIYDAKKRQIRALDFIGTAPAATKLQMFTIGARLWDRAHPARDSFRAVLVPGTVAMWAALLENYGTLSWQQVLAPAIEYAEKGFPVTPRLQESIGPWAVGQYPYGASIFFKDGKPWPAADILKQQDVANTLKIIAAGGAKAFYDGPLTDQFVKHFQDNGGILTRKDFAAYKALWREPVTTTYRGFDVYSHPPGSGGMTVLQALNTLEQFDLNALGHNSAEFVHVAGEAMKLAFVDDDQYNTGKSYAKIPLDRLLSKGYAKEQANKIDRARAKFYPPVRPGSPYQSEHTINHVIVDRDHNVVTMTQTAMHSRVTVPGTGVVFNEDMTYFSTDPQDVNVIEAGQRPRLVMSPTIVMRHGEPYLALGAGGGWTINQTVLQVILRVLDFDQDAWEAVGAPRFVLRYLANSIPYLPGTDLDLERGFPDVVRDALTAKGHNLRALGDNFGGLSAVKIYPHGALSGRADPRRDGQQVGW